MSLDILRRTGGWCVELTTPLKHNGKDVLAVELRPPTADHIIRWGEGQIVSSMALMSEISDLPEKLLRQLSGTDFERVMMAFINVCPPVIKTDLQNGGRPLASPAEAIADQPPPQDPVDPRFPVTDGPVRRFKPAKAAEPADTSSGMNIEPPSIAEAVRR